MDTSGLPIILKEMSDALDNWILNFQKAIPDVLEDYSEAKKLYHNYNVFPNWTKCPVYNIFKKKHVYERFAFYKNVEYARAFANTIHEFNADVSLFAGFTLSYEGCIGGTQFDDFCDAVEIERKGVERKALLLVEHLNLIYSQFEIVDADKPKAKEQKVSLTDREETVLFDMAAHEHQCRLRCTISATTNICEGTVKKILKSFKEKGLIHCPKGTRSGYTITEDGILLYKNISTD